MAEINQLTALDTLVAGDLFPVYSSANGDARKAAASVLLAYMQDNLVFPTQLITQYSSPSSTAFSVQITDSSVSTHLILTPDAGYADGTIVLPALANCEDRQEILVNSTQAVTTFVVDGNGSTVIGAPATLAANAYFRLKFDAVLSTWYRIG